jgi:hypothetical protein
LLDRSVVNFRFCLGSVSKARIEVKEHYEAKRLEEQAAERSSMPYRAPELFNIPSQAKVDEKTDVWVRKIYFVVLGLVLNIEKQLKEKIRSVSVLRMYSFRIMLLQVTL